MDKEKENDINENCLVGGIRTVDEGKIVISKIFYADFTKVNSLLYEGKYLYVLGW